MKRIMNTNLLKGHEFNKFSKKDNYEIWIDSIKIDLFSQLPDARKFIEYAENPPDDHCTKDKDGHKHITPQDIRKELNDGEIGVFDCSKKIAEQIDFNIYALLNNLTRDHPVAHGKIKHKNAETKYGTLAWHNLKNFYHETTVEYEMQCMKHALDVNTCGSMEQLAVKLDQWLYAVDKIAKLSPAKALPVDYQFCIFKQLIPSSVEDTIETNKVDYGNYDDALRYVQTLIRRHQEKSTPVPMDIGNIEQANGEQKPEQPHEHKEEQEHEQQHNHTGDSFDEAQWDIDALGKGKSGKGGKGRQCYHCGRRGHIKSECHFAHLPWEQTPMGHHHTMMKTGQYTKGKGKGYGKPKGFGKGYGKPKGGKPFNFSSKGKGKDGGKPFGGKGKGIGAIEHEWDNAQWNTEWGNEYHDEYPRPPVIALCAVERKGPAVEQTPNLDSEIDIRIDRTAVNNMYFDCQYEQLSDYIMYAIADKTASLYCNSDSWDEVNTTSRSRYDDDVEYSYAGDDSHIQSIIEGHERNIGAHNNSNNMSPNSNDNSKTKQHKIPKPEKFLHHHNHHHQHHHRHLSRRSLRRLPAMERPQAASHNLAIRACSKCGLDKPTVSRSGPL
jgi:hypothetical protein